MCYGVLGLCIVLKWWIRLRITAFNDLACKLVIRCDPILQQQRYIVFSDKYASQFGSGSQYAYFHDEDESTFHLVDTTRVQKPPYQRGRFKGNQRNLRGRGMRGGMQSGGMQTLGKGLKSRDRDKRNQVKKWGQGRVSVKCKMPYLSLNCP